MEQEKVEQTIGDYTFVTFDYNIEQAYYQGNPIDCMDIPDAIYSQIDGLK